MTYKDMTFEQISKFLDEYNSIENLSDEEYTDVLQKQCEEENPYSLYSMGCMLINGERGIEKNIELGIKYVKHAQRITGYKWTNLQPDFYNSGMYEECVQDFIECIEAGAEEPTNFISFKFDNGIEWEGDAFKKLFPFILKKGINGSYGALVMLEHIFGDDDYLGRTFEPNKELSNIFREMQKDSHKTDLAIYKIKEQHI